MEITESLTPNSSIQINNNDDDKTFNKLKELQKLIKKESAIKELYIKMKNETKNSIERQCVDVYKKKIEVLDILQKLNQSQLEKNKNKNSSKNIKEHILIENNYEYLSNLNVFVSNILRYVWEEPKLLADILLKTDKEEVKEYLAPLICNNFYENILSPNYIEDPLIYIIYLLLKHEIDKIQDINKDLDKFLHDTPCSYLLGQLIEKNDVKEFFKIILEDILEEIGTDKFIFSIKELAKWKKEKGVKVNEQVFDKNYLESQNVDNRGRRKSMEPNNLIENDLTKVKTLSKIDIQGINEDTKENIKNNINYQVFTANYITSIPLSELKENLEKNKDNIYLKEYYENLLKNADGDPDAYAQISIIENMVQMENSDSLLVFYQENFLKIKEFLTQFLENFLTNYRIIPYTIKSVCKIIHQLVNNKFKDANEIQKSAFINKFLYKTLIFPVIQQPDINALINNYIISNNTLDNMKIITDIFSTLISFKLFKDKDDNQYFAPGNYTPFNRLFLEIIPQVFELNKVILDVNLPKFIDGLINKTINEDEYCFDYFNENPNEISFYQSIFLNIHEFNALFLNLVKFKEKFLEPKKEEQTNSTIKEDSIYSEIKKKSDKNKHFILLALKKIKSPDNYKILTELLEKREISVTKTKIKSEKLFSKSKVVESYKEKVKYFHVSQLLFNEISKKILSLEQKRFYYHIKELKEKDFKDIGTKELLMKNNIIKCKNFMSSILYNYRILEKSDFNEGTTNNTIDILKELKHFMKSSNYLIDGTIPSDWYCVSLMECLKKLPDEYKLNEYQKLFDELTQELNDSIKKCDFEYMSMFLDEMKFGNRNKAYLEKVKEIYVDIELNYKANHIIETENINYEIYHNLNAKKKEFYIAKDDIRDEQIKFLDSFVFDENSKKRHPKTIDQFTKDFPNLTQVKLPDEYNEEGKIGVFELQRELDIPNKITDFLNYIKTKLQKKIKNENELNIINNKIYDYVMSRIYEKIYPKRNTEKDAVLFRNSCKLSWIEPVNILKDKTHYEFDFVLPDINNYFKLITSEKSPRKKTNNINEIFSAINKLLKFTKGDIPIGVDDQMPLLIYCFIKSRPWLINTNCYFMRLYIGNKKNKIEDNELSQLFTVCDFIEQVDHSMLNNITKEEFKEKVKLSLEETQEYMDQFL